MKIWEYHSPPWKNVACPQATATSGCYSKHPPSKWNPHVEGLPICHNVSCMSNSKASSLECLEWPPTKRLDTLPDQ